MNAPKPDSNPHDPDFVPPGQDEDFVPPGQAKPRADQDLPEDQPVPDQSLPEEQPEP